MKRYRSIVAISMNIADFGPDSPGTLSPIEGLDGRTGSRYKHVAFVPWPLDREPEVSTPTWYAISGAVHALGQVKTTSLVVSQRTARLLRRPAAQREAQSTSALEGTYAPLRDVLAAAALEASAPRSAELHEVLNYVRVADLGLSRVADRRELPSVPEIAALHGILVAGTPSESADAGMIRRRQVFIGEPGAPIQEARFVPMPNGQPLDAAVQDLLRWIQASLVDGRHQVIAAAQAHYQFETLHPFTDGNGRLGRMLIVAQLLLSGLIDEPILTVSPWFEARKDTYNELLYRVSTRGDWDQWIRFFARGVEASANDAAARVKDLLAVQVEFAEGIRHARGSVVATELAQNLIAYPFVSVALGCKVTHRTYPAVNKAIAKLVELGILREVTGRSYGRMFEAPRVVEILTRPSA